MGPMEAKEIYNLGEDMPSVIYYDDNLKIFSKKKHSPVCKNGKFGAITLNNIAFLADDPDSEDIGGAEALTDIGLVKIVNQGGAYRFEKQELTEEKAGEIYSKLSREYTAAKEKREEETRILLESHTERHLY